MRARAKTFICFLLHCGQKEKKMQSAAKQRNESQERKENTRPLFRILVGSLTEQEDTRFSCKMVVQDVFSKENPSNYIQNDWNLLLLNITVIVFKQETISNLNCNTYENRKGGPVACERFPFLFSQSAFFTMLK